MPAAFFEGGRAGRGQVNVFSLGWETILEVGKQHEDTERKLEYFDIMIFPEDTWNFTLKKKRTSENHGDGTLR